MNHNFAIETHAAERYVLGELTSRERDEYEEHMFNCTACAEEVKCAFELGEGLRMAFEEQPGLGRYVPEERPSFWKKLWQPVPMGALAAALLATGFTGYQSMVIRGLTQTSTAQLLPDRADLKAVGAAHGSEEQGQELTIHKGQPAFRISFDIPGGGAASSYDIQILAETGIEKASLKASQHVATNPVQILLSTKAFNSGKYVVVVKKSGEKGEVAQFPFELKIED